MASCLYSGNERTLAKRPSFSTCEAKSVALGSLARRSALRVSACFRAGMAPVVLPMEARTAARSYQASGAFGTVLVNFSRVASSFG